MKIFELFDKPKADVESRPFKGSEEFGVSKTIDGRVIVFKATKEVVAKSFAMIHGLTDQAEWIVQFTDNTVGDSTYDKTGKGNEFKVFQFVMDGLRTFIKEYDPEFISFESKIREPSRVKLYDRMVKRLASDYNVVRKDGAFNSPHNGNSSKEYRLFAKRLKPMGGLHEDQATHKKYKGGELHYNWKDDLEDEEFEGYIPKGYSKRVLELGGIYADEPGKGLGDKMMKDFLASPVAKEAELIFLDPVPNLGKNHGSKDSEEQQIRRLQAFYRRYGFKNNPKSNRMWLVQKGTIPDSKLPT